MTRKNDESMTEFYFNLLQDTKLKYGEKTFLIMQCGSFYEVYGYEDNKDDDVYHYMDIMDTNGFLKGTHNGRPVLCAGWPKDKFINSSSRYTKKFYPLGWKLVLWVETGEKNKDGSKIRKFYKVFSPGTDTTFNNDSILTNNFNCIWVEKHGQDFHNKTPYINCGIANINTITGKSIMYQYKYTSSAIDTSSAYEELERFNSINYPNEVIIIHNLNDNELRNLINFSNLNSCQKINSYSINFDNSYTKLINNCESPKYQYEILNTIFKPNDPDIFMQSYGFNEFYYATCSYCLLLKFIWDCDNSLIEKLNVPVIQSLDDKLVLRTHTLQQLHIINTGENHNLSSVCNLINKCVTNMGKRHFKQLLTSPSNNVDFLQYEYNTIEYTINNWNSMEKIRNVWLKGVRDIEKFYRKIILKIATPSDISLFYYNLCQLEELNNFIINDKYYSKYILHTCKTMPTKSIDILKKLIENSIDVEKAKLIKDINDSRHWDNDNNPNFFYRNVNNQLNVYEKQYIEDYQKLQWIKHNISAQIFKNNGCTESQYSNDKVVYIHQTDKGGLFLKATNKRATAFTNTNFSISCNEALDLKSKYDNKPIKYIIKFNEITTKGVGGGDSKSKKFHSSELNNLYFQIIQNTSNLKEQINCVFKQFLDELKNYFEDINLIIKFVTTLDVMLNKSYISRKYNYCKPTIKNKADKSFFDAKQLIHPLIYHIQTNECYVPNDISLGLHNNGVLLYGTNGCGKSSLIRSIGIAIIMAQSGMFVPASQFTFKPYNSIFTRILGNDNLFKSLSSFGVEMSEFQTIEALADKNSLILGDELCSGTESLSARSIFMAGLKILNNVNASHIFATHMHELASYKFIQDITTLHIKHMSIRCVNNIIEYERILKDGKGPGSYGLEVCKSLPFSQEFMNMAFDIRNSLSLENTFVGDRNTSNYNAQKIKGLCEWCGKNGEEIHHLNPQQKADANGWIQNDMMHKNHTANLSNVCSDCHKNFTKNEIVHKRVKTTSGFQLKEI